MDDEWETPALYYTLRSLLDVWQSSSVHYLREARSVLNLFKNRCFSFPTSWEPDSGATSCEPYKGVQRKPFINIEGNANGIRDYIAREVSAALGAELLLNPPLCLVPLKQTYGDPSNRLHGPYLSLGVYASAHAVKVHWGNKPVVMTGYWNDITAASIADMFINLTTPRAVSPIYEFPKDLLKPDLTIFLNTFDHAPDSREETRLPNWKNMFTEAFLNFKNIKLRVVKWFGADNATNTMLQLIENELDGRFDWQIKN